MTSRPSGGAGGGDTAATFGSVAGQYKSARPGYPAQLFQSLAKLAPGKGTALDVGCGNGQASLDLARHFDRVLACDKSAEQVRQAPRGEGKVRFYCSPAETLPLRDGCADLVLAAQAAHWFDLPPFYEEVRRVAKPGAALAMVCYADPWLDSEPAQQVLEDFLRRVVVGWWPKGRTLVEDRYEPLRENFPFAPLELPQGMELHRDLDLQGLLGYLQSMSSYARLRAGGVPDPLPATRAAFAQVWPDNGKAAMGLHWPLAHLCGRVE